MTDNHDPEATGPGEHHVSSPDQSSALAPVASRHDEVAAARPDALPPPLDPPADGVDPGAEAGVPSPASAAKPASFADFDLPEDLLRAVESMGWSTPTVVQARTFEAISSGTDVLVQSQTGSGKTGAFCLPWLARRYEAKPPAETGVQLLVLLPTRELAKQVCEELASLARNRPVQVLPVYGGTAMPPQLDALRAGVHAVVGTPGRILDHIRRRSLKLDRAHTVVLDECDEMLSMGFLEDIRAILDACPPADQRQTALFSATMPMDVNRIARRSMSNPVRIQLSGDDIAAAEIHHSYYQTRSGLKTNDLLDLVMIEDPGTSIVFCNTREETRLIASVLQRAGYVAEALSSDLTQAARETVMRQMRESRLRFLVATDIAARGIDISHVSHVINYSFPDSPEAYVHRTGRTGRAGRPGRALSLISPQEVGSFYMLGRQYPSIQITESTWPPMAELEQQRVAVKIDRLSSAYGIPVSPEWIQLARDLGDDPRGERIVAFLLAEASAKLEQETRRRAAEALEEWERAPQVDDGRERDRGRHDERGGRGRDERGSRTGSRRGHEGRGDRHEGRGDRHEGRGDRHAGRGDRHAGRGDRHAGRGDRQAGREGAELAEATEVRGDAEIQTPAEERLPASQGAPPSRERGEELEMLAETERAEDEGGTAEVGEGSGDERGEGESTPRRGRRRRRRGRGRDRGGAETSPSESPSSDGGGREDGAEVGPPGDADEGDDLDSVAGGSTAAPPGSDEAQPRRRRRRRRGRGRGDGAQPESASEATSARRSRQGDADGDLEDAYRVGDQGERRDDAGGEVSDGSEGGEDADGRRRRRRRRRRGGESGESASPRPEEIPSTPRLAQDEIVIEIDEDELEAVRDAFGTIDELGDLTVMGRRRAVMDDLRDDVVLEDLSASDAQSDDGEDEFEDEADDADDTDARADEAGPSRDEATSSAEARGVAPLAAGTVATASEPIAEGDEGTRKRRRRRRRKKAEAPALPELTAPPHKDFWEVWSAKFTVADFEDANFDAELEAEFAPKPPPPRRAGTSSVPTPRRSSTAAPPPTATSGALARLRLNVGRSQGFKAAGIRGLLADLAGLEGRSVRDLTVDEQSTLFRVDTELVAHALETIAGREVDGRTLHLERADDDAGAAPAAGEPTPPDPSGDSDHVPREQAPDRNEGSAALPPEASPTPPLEGG